MANLTPTEKAAWQRRHRQKRLDYLTWIKRAEGCADCGYNAHAVALDFDHRPDEEKLGNIADMVTYSMTKLYDEIAKCDVVCANCHRVRTAIKFKFSGTTT